MRKFDPRRFRGLGHIGDDERLIGLLMIRDEADVLPEMLAEATRWFDRILVLDGTTVQRTETDAILAATPEVVFVVRDDQVPQPVRDGARQHLLDEARHRFGVDNWIGVLHGDELIERDPRPLLASRHPSLDPSIRIRLVHTFLHVDDKEDWDERSRLPVRERLSHCMWPGVPEARFFFDRGDRDYEVGRHSKVVPSSLRAGPLVDGFTVVQYNERTPGQVLARARQRAESRWQDGHYGRFTGAADGDESAFVATLDATDTPLAPEFVNTVDGRFRPARRVAVGVGPRSGVSMCFVGGRDASLVRSRGEQLAVDRGARLLDPSLRYLTEPGGALDLIEKSGAGALKRFRAMLLTEPAPSLGYEAEVGLLLDVFGSRRVSAAQRRSSLRDFVLSTVEASHDPPTPFVDISPANGGRAGELKMVFPEAHVELV